VSWHNAVVLGTGAQAHLAVYASRDKTSPAKNYGTNYYTKELPEFSELLVHKTNISVILLLSNNKAQFLQSMKT